MIDAPDILVLAGWVILGCAVYAITPWAAMGYAGVSLIALGVRLHRIRQAGRASQG